MRKYRLCTRESTDFSLAKVETLWKKKNQWIVKFEPDYIQQALNIRLKSLDV